MAISPFSSRPAIAAFLSALLLAAVAAAQERVTFTASDGQPLAGEHRAPEGSPRGGVVLLHMARGNRSMWGDFPRRLALGGFAVLSLDLRGHGDSARDAEGKPIGLETGASGPEPVPARDFERDVEAAMAELVRRGAPKDRIALIGADLGASVAVHAAAGLGSPAALVLLSPMETVLGLRLMEKARQLPAIPVLILAPEEELSLGARTLHQALERDSAELRVLEEREIHGTRMLGRVPAIEADILEWLGRALTSSLKLTIPMVRDVMIDGAIETTEGTGATSLDVPLEGTAVARIRLSRNRSRLIVGVAVPERHLRLNALAIYLDASGEGPSALNESCWRISYNPNNPARAPLVVSRGEQGAWKDVPAEGIQAYARTEERSRWSAEIALPLDRFVPKAAPAKVRLAFEIQGGKPEARRPFPASANLGLAPRLWIEAQLEGAQ